MAKYRRRKKKNSYRFTACCGVFFVICLVASLMFSLFIRTRNDQLSIDIQEMTNEIALLKGENKDLDIEIQSLKNKDRVYVMAETAGLNQIQSNIVSIGD